MRDAGPNSLSLRAVQRRAEVSPAAAYRHFRDRDALLFAVAQEAAGLLADRLAAELEHAPAANDARSARIRLRMACEAYIAFATENPGLYRAIFYSNEQVDELTHPAERSRGVAGEGGFNILVGLLDVLSEAVGLAEADPWDPVVVWSSLHGLALLRLNAALRSLSPEVFAQAEARVLDTITAAVPLEAH